MTKHQQQSCNDERGISLQNDWYPFKNQLNYKLFSNSNDLSHI